MTTDIVIGTYNRMDLLPRTIAHLVARTTTLYRLHVLNDCSADGTAAYLDEQLAAGVLAAVYHRPRPAGIAANLRAALKITTSDPLIFTDDDVLCPQVEPDWLARLRAEMEAHPDLGILALNNPQANLRGDRRRVVGPTGAVTRCGYVGATLAAIRRAALQACPVPDGVLSPLKHFCQLLTAAGWGVGYLTTTYCQHLGAFSVRRDLSYTAELAAVMPQNKETLEPPDAYKG